MSVAEDDSSGERVAFLHLQTVTDFFTGHQNCHISDLAVARSHDGKGIGRALLAYAEKFAREHRYERLQLSVFPGNERARIAYAFREKLVRGDVALPPDDELLEELRAYKAFANSAGKQQCVSKAELRSVLGRSPDKMDAVLLATCADVAPTFDQGHGAVAF